MEGSSDPFDVGAAPGVLPAASSQHLQLIGSGLAHVFIPIGQGLIQQQHGARTSDVPEDFDRLLPDRGISVSQRAGQGLSSRIPANLLPTAGS